MELLHRQETRWEMDSCFVSLCLCIVMFIDIHSSLIFRPFFTTSCSVGNSHLCHIRPPRLNNCAGNFPPAPAASLLRGHFERPNVLATIHLHLQFSMSQEPPGVEIAAVRKKIAATATRHSRQRYKILCSITSISLFCRKEKIDIFISAFSSQTFTDRTSPPRGGDGVYH